MDGKRQKIQQPNLAFMPECRGEAPMADVQGTEPPMAKRAAESPTGLARLMEEVCEPENLRRAWQQVKANQGSPGVDGMTIERTEGYLKQQWPAIREELLAGRYRPAPVRRVEIPKPDGGVRKLGIPTVVDRLIQQAIGQVLGPRWDPTFNEHSFGFRPGRSCHQAVAKAQAYIDAGYRWVVDIDLEKFFDRVNHDRLMAAIAKRVEDKRLLRLIRAFLSAGVLENGLVSPTDEGAPQGGPLSPLLSNLVLDELDRELEKRGHRFVRYADDCNIYVASERAGQRVMAGVSGFITKRLKLKVNESKSAVARPWARKFLSFSFTGNRQSKRRIAPKALARFKARVRELTRRTRGVSLKRVIGDLGRYLPGWRNYFGFCQTLSVLAGLDEWVRRRLRCYCWKQWKTGKRRFERLTALGVPRRSAAEAVGSGRGCWRMSASPPLQHGLSRMFFAQQGLVSVAAAGPV
jgi:RNA-directed DNA polymerase